MWYVCANYNRICSPPCSKVPGNWTYARASPLRMSNFQYFPLPESSGMSEYLDRYSYVHIVVAECNAVSSLHELRSPPRMKMPYLLTTLFAIQFLAWKYPNFFFL